MIITFSKIALLVSCFTLAGLGFRAKPVSAGSRTAEGIPPAIVLAAFGTSEPQALKAIQNIADRVKAAFPDHEIKLAFTSSIIRKKWRSRLDDADFKKANPDLPEEFYQVKSPLATMALLREAGPRAILVQSLHITNGEEYADLQSVVENLGRMAAVQDKNKPFPKIALGQSVFGSGSPEELKKAALAVGPLVDQARERKAALVLMGHGSPSYSNQVYTDFEKVINEACQYPIFLGLVDGDPELDQVVEKLNQAKSQNLVGDKLYLAPLMVVAGDHARNDMAGPEDDSWVSILTVAGYRADIHMAGLGDLDGWADLYVERLEELQKLLS